MNFYLFVIGCCAVVAVIIGWGEVRFHMGRHSGYQEAELDRSIARAERRKHGKHEARQPRTSLAGSPPALPPEMTPPRPVPARDDPNRWRTWSPGVSPRSVSAASIAPVVLPEPGTYLPGPRRSTSPGTVTFPKVQLDTATTGEIRAIGDEMVAAIEAAGEA